MQLKGKELMMLEKDYKARKCKEDAAKILLDAATGTNARQELENKQLMLKARELELENTALAKKLLQTQARLQIAEEKLIELLLLEANKT